MSVGLEQLHLLIGTCLDMAGHMAPGAGRSLILDLADEFVSQARVLDSDAPPAMPALPTEVPGRDTGIPSEPEED